MIHKTEPARTIEYTGLTTASRGKRLNSASKRKESDNSINSKSGGKRLLNDGKRKKKNLYNSNSTKRLESAKPAKRTSTPRRRKEESESRKKASNSFSKAKDNSFGNTEKPAKGFQKPPTNKKMPFSSTLDKYRNESNHPYFKLRSLECYHGS